MPKLVQAAPDKEAALKQIKVQGNWMVPDLQKKAALAYNKKVGYATAKIKERSSQKTIQMIETGRKKQAHLVIDNLQSGPGAGKAIAKELGIKNVTLTNFPGGLTGTETYLKALEKNVNLILANWK